MPPSSGPATLRGEAARNQLISAAIAHFGESGLSATTRDIAAAAGQNIAAITYYFGSKEDLYLASAEWIAGFINQHFQPHALRAEALLREPAPDTLRLRQLLYDASRDMIQLTTADETLNLSKFISREQLSPTAAYQLIHDRVLAPLHSLLTRLIAAITGCAAEATSTILHAHALIGQILAFRFVRETILLRAGWTRFDTEQVTAIVQVVRQQIDWILDGLSATRSRER